MVKAALSWALVLYLGLQRLWELRAARSNERVLEAAGALEVAPGHYPVMVTFHLAFFAVLLDSLAGGSRLGQASLPWLGAFAAAQALRFWSIRHLGPRWTTRLWTVPGGKGLVAGGPYRWFRHPIYAAVVVEILSVPMAYGRPGWALVLSAVNGAILWARISAENDCLEAEEESASPGRAPA